MAQPLTCDLCQAAEADLMVSNVHNGDTTAMCTGCWAAAGVALQAAADGAADLADADPAGIGFDPAAAPADPPVPDEGPAPVPLDVLIGDPGDPDTPSSR